MRGGGVIPPSPPWLLITPTYLDKVTLYQPEGDSHAWRGRHSGDRVPMAQRMPTRQLLFPLTEGRPLILRLETTSAAQLYPVVLRTTALIAHLASEDWAIGAFVGVFLTLAILLGDAALALRSRPLAAVTMFAIVNLVHGISMQGYPILWLPEPHAGWTDTLVSVGVFLLPAAYICQARELLTRGSRWRQLDKTLIVLSIAFLLGIASIPLWGTDFLPHSPFSSRGSSAYC